MRIINYNINESLYRQVVEIRRICPFSKEFNSAYLMQARRNELEKEIKLKKMLIA